jgi:hypothetical protein
LSGATFTGNISATDLATTSGNATLGSGRASDGASTLSFRTVTNVGTGSAQATITRGSGFNAALTITNLGTGGMFFANGNAGAVVVRVKGYPSQTANLQEWQNSAGTSLARVANNGNMVAQEFYTTGGVFAAGISTLTGLIVLGESFSGGTIRMTRATATQPSPGANQGRLYFRNGTNAGTLKLVVRAGTAGAETTILDNIPQ